MTADPLAAAIRFTFGGEHPYFERPRTVWGIPVVFRVLSAEDAEAADLAADRLPSAAANALERGVQMLARSIVGIDGQPYAGEYRPGAADPEALETLRARLDHLHALPALLVSECAGAFQSVCDEYAGLLSPETVGESSAAAGESGASSRA